MTDLLLWMLTLVGLVLVARVVVDLVVPVVPLGSGAHEPLGRARAGLHRVTEPALAPVRRVLPPARLGPVTIDLSIVVVLLGVAVLRTLLRG